MAVDTRMYDGYLNSAISTSGLDGDEYRVFDFAEPARNKARADLERFVEQAGALLDGLEPAQIGADFWITRNLQGAGFWDKEAYGDRCTQLCELAISFDEASCYVGMSGKIHFYP